MIDIHAHPAPIKGQVIDPGGNDLAQLLVVKGLRPHFLGAASAVPFSARIAEIPDKFLLIVSSDTTAWPRPWKARTCRLTYSN